MTVSASAEAAPDAVAAMLVAGLELALPRGVEAVLAHGSWVHGDFAPGRSDLDLLVVTVAEPDEALVTAAARVIDAVVEAHPAWRDRIEIGFVTGAGMAAVVCGGEQAGRMARVSPGEPLHLMPLSRHHVLDWEAARNGRALRGDPSVVPEISAALVAEVVRAHLAEWPTWVEGLDAAGREADGLRAYAVFTVCRAQALLAGHGRVSKRQAVRWSASSMPGHIDLVSWAEAWWYGDPAAASRALPPAPASVEAFVAQAARSAGAGSV